MIKGGYILQPRIIKNSEVAHMSPCTREVWLFLIREVRYDDNGNLKRGQAFINIDDIRDGLSWYVGYRKETYSRRSVEGALKVLRERGMIVTTKVTHGMIVTICKYDYYQDPKNYEGNNEGTAKVTTKVERTSESGPDIIKKDNKERKKELNKEINLMSGLSASDDLHEKIAFSFWVLFKEKLAEYKINSTDLEKAKSKNWVTAIRLMMDSDKRTQDEIREVFTYLKNEKPKDGGFAWSKVIQSTETLRKKFEKVLRESRDVKKPRNGSTVSDAFKKQILEEAINSKPE